ncbi:MAG TPA: NAD(P)H-binding protein [Chloroflexota bacterium]|nr:NAD(P)H-binding protein [Chloroflexota bacterium]
MILVTGAAGNVGGSVVRQLLAAGERVRALTRNPAARLPRGVEVVVGDLADPATLAAAFDGVDRMFLFPALGISAEVAQLARERGVRRAIVLSSAAIQRAAPRDNPIVAKHDAVEQAVRTAGLAWTMLRPDTFATNTLAWAPSIRAASVVRAAYGRAQRNPIHEADVAAVATAALLEDGHEGAVYLLTGPASITQAEQAAAIGHAIGREVRFEELSREQALAELTTHTARPVAERLLDYLARSVDRPPHLEPTVEQVTGRPARTFAQWAADHADDFR